jgi:hypothetical protein
LCKGFDHEYAACNFTELGMPFFEVKVWRSVVTIEHATLRLNVDDADIAACGSIEAAAQVIVDGTISGSDDLGWSSGAPSTTFPMVVAGSAKISGDECKLQPPQPQPQPPLPLEFVALAPAVTAPNAQFSRPSLFVVRVRSKRALGA